MSVNHSAQQFLIEIFNFLFSIYVDSNSHHVREGGLGDGYTSLGFDGKNFWLSGNPLPVSVGSDSKPRSPQKLVRQKVCVALLN